MNEYDYMVDSWMKTSFIYYSGHHFGEKFLYMCVYVCNGWFRRTKKEKIYFKALNICHSVCCYCHFVCLWLLLLFCFRRWFFFIIPFHHHHHHYLIGNFVDFFLLVFIYCGLWCDDESQTTYQYNKQTWTCPICVVHQYVKWNNDNNK